MAADPLTLAGGPFRGPNVTESTFRAMGTDVHVLVVDGPPDAPALARARIAELEDTWSRFRPDSEISRLNARAGAWVPISPDTLLLLELAQDGWQRTGGIFDPTILRALEAAGYDRSFELVTGADPAPADVPPAPRDPHPAPGLGGLELDGTRARLAPGTAFDPGGIGKGLAADLVAAELVAGGGARGAMVNLGGDIRVLGDAPDDDGWGVELAPLGTPVGVVGLTEGAIATSTVTRRRWMQAGQPRHHLIDPSTGSPAPHPPLAATVVAGEGWLAEVLTKILLIGRLERARQVLRDAGATGLLVTARGDLVPLPGMAAYLTPLSDLRKESP